MGVTLEYETSSTQTVLILFFCLVALLFLLFFLYKKLNKETQGEYTIRHLVYKEGGLRDRVRGIVLPLETRLGVQLWPRGDADEDGEEMQEVQVEERQVEDGTSQGSDIEGDNQEDEAEDEGDGAVGSSGDNSSLESSVAGETARLIDEPDTKGEKVEKVEDGEGEGGASEGAGLLIDLKQYSGSATWSESGVCKDGDVTAL